MTRGQLSRRAWTRSLVIAIVGIPLAILVSFGILHITIVLQGHTSLLPITSQVQRPLLFFPYQAFGSELSKTDTTQDVLPIPCHSHNDFLRKHPLFDAISVGCTSVEADLWLLSNDTEVYVGHKKHSLSKDRTLNNLYLNRIVELLVKSNQSGGGIFAMAPDQPLILLLDFKTDGHALWSRVQEYVQPLREKDFLSFWDGSKVVARAVTLVISGNVPSDLAAQQISRHDMFIDAPLDEMWDSPNEGEPLPLNRSAGGDWSTRTALYASTSFAKTIGKSWLGRLSSSQIELIRGQIRGAHQRGLKVRYWDTPSWPISLRNHVWQVLISEGCDVLNVDDLYAAAFLDWNLQVPHTWFNG